jgi:hypothetical protein
MRTSTVVDAAPSPVRSIGLPVAVERDDGTSTRLLGELDRDFPTVDRPVLAAAARSALAEFADARIRHYVPVLALRLARDLVRATTGVRPLARSARSAS